MKVLHYGELLETDRQVDCPKGGFQSLRILLESDNMGYTLTRTTVFKGDEQLWHYKNHLETCYCVQGRGILTDLETGDKFKIQAGVTYILDKHDKHSFKALTDCILICVFNPPLKGKEVHQKDGSYV